MAETLLDRINQAKGGRRWQADYNLIMELENPKAKIIELRSLFRFRLFLPQAEYRDKFPSLKVTDEFFEQLNKDIQQWYTELEDAYMKGEIDLGEYELPDYADLLEDAVKNGAATSVESNAWFMTSRNEPVQKVSGLLTNSEK